MAVPMVGGDSESRDPFTIPLTIRLRKLRFIGLVAAFSIFMVTLTLLFSLNDGVTLQSFLSSKKTAAQQSELLDNYNSYTGSVTSALGQSIDFFVGAAMPVAYLCFASTHAMEVKQTVLMTAFATGAPMLIKYLLGNGFRRHERPDLSQSAQARGDLERSVFWNVRGGHAAGRFDQRLEPRA